MKRYMSIKQKLAKKEYDHLHYEENKEKYLAYGRAYYQDHKEEVKAHNHEYYQQHSAELRVYNRAYYAQHKQEIAERRKRRSQEVSDGTVGT